MQIAYLASPLYTIYVSGTHDITNILQIYYKRNKLNFELIRNNLFFFNLSFKMFFEEDNLRNAEIQEQT